MKHETIKVEKFRAEIKCLERIKERKSGKTDEEWKKGLYKILKS